MNTKKTCFLFAAAVSMTLLPSVLRAQSTISGVVTDSSGSVIPGARVEAASPALIEVAHLNNRWPGTICHLRRPARHLHRDLYGGWIQYGQKRQR